jgi:hypothetical protein
MPRSVTLVTRRAVEGGWKLVGAGLDGLVRVIRSVRVGPS